MKQGEAGLSIVATFLGAFVVVGMDGQILHASAPLPTFEVATVKPWRANPRPLSAPAPVRLDPVHGVRRQETNRVHFIGQIALLIMDAYNLPIGSDKRILKGPEWVDSESNRYEIEAKIDSSHFAEMQRMSPEQQQEQVSLMEQSLLAERFNLRLHFEMRGEAPVYALVIAKGGSKLVPAKEGEQMQLVSRGNAISGQAVTLDQFVHSPLWTPIGNRFVINQTGLTGAYDFDLKWRADSLDGQEVIETAADLPPLFDAIQEQLGLKVIDSKAPLEVLVIDHITRPTPN